MERTGGEEDQRDSYPDWARTIILRGLNSTVTGTQEGLYVCPNRVDRRREVWHCPSADVPSACLGRYRGTDCTVPAECGGACGAGGGVRHGGIYRLPRDAGAGEAG